MADVAASGGYYMSMACNKIVAEPLTITGSIGVVTGKFNLAELYAKASCHQILLLSIRLMYMLLLPTKHALVWGWPCCVCTTEGAVRHK